MASMASSGLPTGIRGRALALALTATLLASLWLGVAVPLMDLYADRADLLERRIALARRMAGVVATLPALQAQQSQDQGPQNRSGTTPPAQALLAGGSDAIAGAALQGLVQDMARDAGTSLTRIETLPAEVRSGYRRIALRVALTAPLPDLVTFLTAVEQASPQMLIDDVQLRGTNTRETPASPPIDVTLTILAFRSGAAGG